MDDLISRAYAINKIENAYREWGEEYGISDVLCDLDDMPSAQRWIPCSEMLPKDDRSKVVTLANGNTECGYYSNGDWWCIGDSITLENPTVIAWMPLPKPYEVKQ